LTQCANIVAFEIDSKIQSRQCINSAGYSICPMRQGRARFFSYAFFVNMGGQGRVKYTTGRARHGRLQGKYGRARCEKLLCEHL